jgi:alpha-N-arabinofuranosidase
LNLSDANRPISPMLYGLMIEDINHSIDGGLYGELIQNRSFKDDPQQPVHWSFVGEDGGGAMALDSNAPVPGTALTVSLRLQATKADRPIGVANDGYWGIPVKPRTRYRASFYAKCEGLTGPLTITIESRDGRTTFAHANVAGPGAAWKLVRAQLSTGGVPITSDARFVIRAHGSGTLWLNQVSLFAPTWNSRPNGSRKDLMQLLKEMHQTFLRLPGGNFLEGNHISERFDWKATIGEIAQRSGHPDPWGYRSSDGFGLLEYLGWCEDLRLEPVLAVFAGYALRREHVAPGPMLQPFVQDALDEIEYVTGGTDTKWGAVRAENGHPAPFKLTYVEIGNEDGFDRSGSYDGRFAQFFDAIKAKYPNLQLIATTRVVSRRPDVMDDHFYRTANQMAADSGHYDHYDRNEPKIFVGEWASQDIDQPWSAPETKGPTPSLNSALGDAAWMTGMERNSDVVIMASYAPLFVNVNSGARQWAVNLIGFDALHSFGSPSYYAQQMFAQYLGDVVVPAEQAGLTPLYSCASKDTKTGTVFLKVVNMTGSAKKTTVELKGTPSIAARAIAVTLAGQLTDMNTLDSPRRVAPVQSDFRPAGPTFSYIFPAYSVTVLVLPQR